jgi:hypothetical protein
LRVEGEGSGFELEDSAPGRLVDNAVRGFGFRVQGFPVRLAPYRSHAKRKQLGRFGGLSQEIQGQILALTVLYVCSGVQVQGSGFLLPSEEGTEGDAFFWQPTCPNPLYCRDNQVDRPRAMGFRIPFSR